MKKHNLETASRRGIFQAQTPPGRGLIKASKRARQGQTGVISGLSVIPTSQNQSDGLRERSHTVNRLGVKRG